MTQPNKGVGYSGDTQTLFEQVRILILLAIEPAFLGLATSISHYTIWGLLTSRSFVTLN